MITHWIGTALSTLALFTVMQPLAANAGPVSYEPLGIGERPTTDGEYVVWTADDQVHALELLTSDLTVIDGHFNDPASSVRRSDATVRDGIAVWVERPRCCPSDPGRIAGATIDTGQRFVFAEAAGGVHGPNPRFHDDSTLLWHDHNTIYGKAVDFSSDQFVVYEIPSDDDPVTDAFIVDLATDGEWVVWIEDHYDAGDDNILNEDEIHRSLKALKIGTETVVTIAGSQTPRLNGGVDVSEGLVAFTHDERVLVHDLSTGSQTMISTDARQPTIDGRYVFWTDTHSSIGGELRADLLAYDLQTNVTFSVAFALGINWFANADSGVLTWQRGNTLSTIHARRISAILPSAFRPEPAFWHPGATYFPETGHSLILGFRDYWEANGGLPVFGFPLTEEFDQTTTDSPRLQRIQIFERQRFEWHPELEGTPYVVLLGRLGAENAVQRGLVGTPAFLPSARMDDGECAYHDATGHNVCEDFLRYWASHGLDFGDEDTSYRESLALFGHPLSEAFVNPETGLLTQYFERAVFERHPDNPPEHQVLLRRLGAKVLDGYGW